MSTFLTILLIILAFFGGMLAGMYLLRKQFEKEFASNPRLNVEAVRLPSNSESTKSIFEYEEEIKAKQMTQ